MHRYFPIWVDHVSSKLLGVDLRLTRLGEGGESAARAVHLAKAVVEDVGFCFLHQPVGPHIIFLTRLYF